MVDLGFGLLDKRTVIVIVLTMAASHALFGNEFPISGREAVEILSQLIFLTGYFYISRSFLRLPVALLLQVSYLIDDSGRFAYLLFPDKWDTGVRHKSFIWKLFYILVTSIAVLLRLPFNLVKFGEWLKVEYKVEPELFQLYDRLSLVGLAFIATLPSMRAQILEIGVAGIAMMVLVFVFRGTFTSFVVDLTDDLKHSKYHPRHNKPLG